MHVYDVIVIGAGISGLSASKALLEASIENFVILEAKDKAGGRVQTVPLGDAHVELGAQWIHGQDNEFFRQARDSGHIHSKASWEAKGNFFTPSGEVVPSETVDEILIWVEKTLEHVEDNFAIETLPEIMSKAESLGSYLRKAFQKHLEDIDRTEPDYQVKMALFQWAMNFQRIDNSCNRISDLSLYRWSEFKVNPGEHYNNFQFGADAFIQSAFQDSRLRLNTPVDKIRWGRDEAEVKVMTASGETLRTLCVIITVSIGVLQAIGHSLFDPGLPPDLSSAIARTGFGPVTKVYLMWEEPWWTGFGAQFLGVQFLWPNRYVNCCDEEDLKAETEADEFPAWARVITGFDPVLDNPNVLLGWIGGDEAILVETLEPGLVGQTCARLLETFTKLPVPAPTRVLISKWNTDPYVRGGYCFRSVEGDQIADITRLLSQPVYSDHKNNKRPVLIFAGEAIHRTQYSTLHGAFDSGKSQAQLLIQHFKFSKQQATTLDQ